MNSTKQLAGSVWLTLALALPMLTTACAEHRYYRAYDPYYHDYHRWDHGEDVYYQRWVVETHRDPHRDFRHLDRDDQKAYWDWRHKQGDHDHDRDDKNRDRDHDHDHR